MSYVLLITALISPHLLGQGTGAPDSGFVKLERAIEDNSFFIEEAYNQERGVVQHISNCSYFSVPAKSVEFTFTQEWPVFGQENQFSFTIPYTRMNGAGRFGDILLNYRYQLFDGDDWAAVAPRFSLLLRTGSGVSSAGSRSAGWMFELPASRRISRSFVAHLNAGVSLEPGFDAGGPDGRIVKRTLTAYNIGGSLIWLATMQLNIMVESIASFADEIGENGELTRNTEAILSPGIRYAIDVGNLQVVPGLALPVRFGSGTSTAGLFFYLSFEHPF